MRQLLGLLSSLSLCENWEWFICKHFGVLMTLPLYLFSPLPSFLPASLSESEPLPCTSINGAPPMFTHDTLMATNFFPSHVLLAPLSHPLFSPNKLPSLPPTDCHKDSQLRYVNVAEFPPASGRYWIRGRPFFITVRTILLTAGSTLIPVICQ